jgi:hypothetical protein
VQQQCHPPPVGASVPDNHFLIDCDRVRAFPVTEREREVCLRAIKEPYELLTAAARGGHWFILSGGLGSPSLLNSLAQQEFDLAVDAAELVLRPGLEPRPQFSVDAEKERFTVSHPDRQL